MATKMRLYRDNRKAYRDFQGKYCLYFPYPKWLQMHDNCKGYGIICEPTANGIWQIEGIYNDRYTVNSNAFYLGNLVKLETMPTAFQKVAKRLEELWHNAITQNTDEAWEKWCKA